MFLRYMISKDGIIVDPAKIEAIRDWPRPTLVIEVKSFIGLVGYYRWFVKRLSTITTPLTHLTH